MCSGKREKKQRGSWCVVLVLFVGLLAPTLVEAHAVRTRFKANRFSLVMLGRDYVHLTYAVAMGDIPAKAQLEKMDRNKDKKISRKEALAYLDRFEQRLLEGLQLRVEGKRVQLRRVRRNIKLRLPQVGYLPFLFTLYLTGSFSPGKKHRLNYHDSTPLAELGETEIHFVALPETRIVASHLQNRPRENRRRFRFQGPRVPPQARREVVVVFVARSKKALAARLDARRKAPPPSREESWSPQRFRRYLSQKKLGVGLILLLLLLSFVWGAGHAVSPGHGKTLVAAYLVGSQGTIRQAIFLGLTVTLTHTFSVFVLGLLTLFASQYILPDRVVHWLSIASGAFIFLLGLWLLHRRLSGDAGHHHHHHSHHDHHGHHHHRDESPHNPEESSVEEKEGVDESSVDESSVEESYDSSLPKTPTEKILPSTPEEATETARVRLGELLSLGITGGIVPCPTALVVLLMAINLQRISLGLLLLVFFSAGLAVVLVAIGILVVKARSLVERFTGEGVWLQRRLPVLSAAVIALLGVFLLGQALVSAGFITIQI